MKQYTASTNDLEDYVGNDPGENDNWSVVYLASEVDAHIAQMQIEIDAVTKQRDDTYAKLVEARTKIQSLTFGLKMMPGSDH